MVRIAGQGSGGSRPEPDVVLVIAVYHDRRVGIESDLSDCLSDGKPTKVLNHAGGHLWLSVMRDVDSSGRGLAQGGDKCFGDIHDRDSGRDRVLTSLVDDLVGAPSQP